VLDRVELNKDIQVGAGEPTFVSVDIGKNHLGSIEFAKELVLQAKDCGVDAVKFQTHIVEDEQRNEQVISPHYHKPRYEWLKENTMPPEWWHEIFSFCKQSQVFAYSTPMSIAAAKMLDEIGVPVFKISSADVSDLEMIEFIAGTEKPVIISTGMHSFDHLEIALRTIRKIHNQIIVMHCVSLYPCPVEKLNLRLIKTLRHRFNVHVGLSDHVISWPVALAAVALGAVAIEKHFSLSRDLPGPDHKVSLTPQELSQMIKRIREVEVALGCGEKRLSEDELLYEPVFHKCLTSRGIIKKDEELTRKMVTLKRPGGGIYWHELSVYLGRKVVKDIPADTLLLPEHFD